MNLTASQAITKHFSMFGRLSRPPSSINPEEMFLVFESLEREPTIEQFIGLVPAAEAIRHPGRIFADLVPKLDPEFMTISGDMPVADVLSELSKRQLSACAVFDRESQVVGAVSMCSLTSSLLARTKLDVSLIN